MGWIHCERCNFAHFSATVVQFQILPKGGGRRIPLFLGSNADFRAWVGRGPAATLHRDPVTEIQGQRTHPPNARLIF
jgi:hypothetical protein